MEYGGISGAELTQMQENRAAADPDRNGATARRLEQRVAVLEGQLKQAMAEIDWLVAHHHPLATGGITGGPMESLI